MRWAMKPVLLRHLLNWWPPFFFSGIRVVTISDDYRYCKVELKSRPWTKNINRSQFGGAMFAMTDPIYPLLLMGALGNEYRVWDKQADINFIRPGYSKLVAEFWLADELVEHVKQQTAAGDKYFPEFLVHIRDAEHNVVCEVNRTLYVRKKPKYR